MQKQNILLLFFALFFSTAHTFETVTSFDTVFKEQYKKKSFSITNPTLTKYLSVDSSLNMKVLLDYIQKSEKPVVLKFYATWCGPCKRLNPIVESVKKHFGNKIDIISIDTDKYATLRIGFGIMGVPTLIFFQNGDEMKRSHGMGKEEMIKLIDGMF